MAAATLAWGRCHCSSCSGSCCCGTPTPCRRQPALATGGFGRTSGSNSRSSSSCLARARLCCFSTCFLRQQQAAAAAAILLSFFGRFLCVGSITQQQQKTNYSLSFSRPGKQQRAKGAAGVGLLFSKEGAGLRRAACFFGSLISSVEPFVCVHRRRVSRLFCVYGRQSGGGGVVEVEGATRNDARAAFGLASLSSPRAFGLKPLEARGLEGD